MDYPRWIITYITSSTPQESLLPSEIMLWVVTLFSFFPASLGDKTFIVDTGYAKYRGNHTYPNNVAYLGIPYAEPPLGDLRYRAPVPLNVTRVSEEASDVVDATSYADFCIQGSPSSGIAGAGSEDCLKVDIYAPTRGKNLPVLVYFHGGGYVYGNPASWPFDHWVDQSPNVVIVSVYYRLSSFGFLALPALQDPTYGDLNAGFLDQIESLRWVKKNVAAFGGNPGRITINGQSAGGGSVQLHLVADLGGETLFHGAIAQSVYRGPVPLVDDLKPLHDFFVEEAGCALGDAASVLVCLRTANISTLARAQDLPRGNRSLTGPYNSFNPVIDNTIIKEYPTKSILADNFAKVPLIVGATSNETNFASNDLRAAIQLAFPKMTESDVTQLIEQYPLSDFDSADQQLRVLTGQSVFICPQTILGEAYANADLPVWAYRYNQRNPTTSDPTVGHAAENWMMFRGSNTGINGTFTLSDMTPVENAFAEELIAYWLSFVRSGDPNTFKLKTSPTWAEFDSEGLQRIVLQHSNTTDRTSFEPFGLEQGGSGGSYMETEPEKEVQRCRYLTGITEKQQS